MKHKETSRLVGALTNSTYSASFTILKFYREGNPNGSPRFSLGYGFKSGETGQFVLHNSNSPDAEPCKRYLYLTSIVYYSLGNQEGALERVQPIRLRYRLHLGPIPRLRHCS